MPKKEHHSLGIFTLVSYVPDPVGRLIEELRKSLPGNGFAQPHITVVPPRPLQVSLQTACDFVMPILGQFSPFEVTLGDVHCFPETNLLYLDLQEGEQEVHGLHKALTRDVLAHKERFEFRPHLTIGGAARETDLREVRGVWVNRNNARKFEVTEVAALWCAPEKAQPEWTRLWTHRLNSNGRT